MKMNKLIISEDVERALETFMDYDGDLEFFVQEKEYFSGGYEPLKQFTVEQFALLLCGWYEVEKPFKVGDWVYREISDSYEKIERIADNDYYVVGDIGILIARNHEWKKVEDPWKIALLEAGRKKPEFVVGDIILMKSIYTWLFENAEDESERIFEMGREGKIERIYLVENAIDIKGGK